MNRREASETIDCMFELQRIGLRRFTEDEKAALTLAKQALDIMATLDERLHLREPVTIENLAQECRVTRGTRTHLGSDVTDALGQLCQTLALE